MLSSPPIRASFGPSFKSISKSFIDLEESSIKRASMSKTLCTALRPATRCKVHCLRKGTFRKISCWTGDLRPLLTQPQHSSRSRQFSTSQPCRAQAVRTAMPAMKQPAQPSMAVAIEKAKQDAIRHGQIVNDIGLLPDTIIMPFKNRPSWLKEFNDRWRLEKKRIKTRIMELSRYA